MDDGGGDKDDPPGTDDARVGILFLGNLMSGSDEVVEVTGGESCDV